MSVFEVVSRFPRTTEVFMKYGLHCFGCSVARYENLEQAAMVHGVPFKKFMEELNKAAK
jgi:hybrid cluster-associated redox disulfide protein